MSTIPPTQKTAQAAPGRLPGDFVNHEADLIRARRTAADFKRPDIDRPNIGFALSGGGIRSATFCLGLFQSLARHKMLRHIDYLSTVSGGGYFGGFLGRMFTRDWVKGDAREVPQKVAPAPVTARFVTPPATAAMAGPVKPGFTGDEPADLINYQRNNPTFPQQSTSDQFYDEAQWESYRKLGEHVMDTVLNDEWLLKKFRPVMPPA